jgi:hypothetical protein
MGLIHCVYFNNVCILKGFKNKEKVIAIDILKKLHPQKDYVLRKLT